MAGMCEPAQGRRMLLNIDLLLVLTFMLGDPMADTGRNSLGLQSCDLLLSFTKQIFPSDMFLIFCELSSFIKMYQTIT